MLWIKLHHKLLAKSFWLIQLQWVVGLLLSLFLIFTLASFFADYIKKHQWLGYVGLIAILIIAIQLIIGGLVNLEVLSINENYKFLFSI